MNNYAGFWIRLCAYTVDTLVLIIAISILTLILPVGVSLVASLTLQLAYFTVLTTKYGCTIGKRLFRLRVINEEGQNPSYLQSTFRYFGCIISGAIFYIGFIMVAFSRSKQGLHDKLCNTYVIRT